MFKSFRLLGAVLGLLVVAAVAVVSPPMHSAFAAQDARVQVYSETYDAASTIDAAGITNPIAAPGAVLGDACVASVSIDVQDVVLTCNIQAAGMAEVRMQNESGATLDLASSTWRVFVFSKGTR